MSSYASLENYIRDIASNLSVANYYFHGRFEVFHEVHDQEVAREDTIIYSFPLISTGDFTENAYQFNETYTVNLVIYQRDEMGSEIDQNNPDTITPEMQIISTTHGLAEEFVRNFGFNTYSTSLNEISEQLEVTNVTMDNVIKDNDWLFTGTLVSITVSVPDEFNYCSTQGLLSVSYTNNNQTIFEAVADGSLSFQDMTPTLEPSGATSEYTLSINGLLIDLNTGVISESVFEDIPIGLNVADVSIVGTGDYSGSLTYTVILYKAPCYELLQAEYNALTERDDEMVYLICDET